ARMQNAGYAAGNFNLCYFYTETDDRYLGEIIEGIRRMPSFIGAAVTKPNKVKVLQYLDELDPLCRKMGACNTVVKLPDGRLKGYNTDGSGFLRSIKEEAGLSIPEHTFFCFGAGGAGRAICSVLAYNGARKIYITDIFRESADKLAGDINANFAPIAEAAPYEDRSAVSESSVVINASGVGMGDTAGQSPLPEELIKAEQFYFDACYNPDKTQFLLNAEKKGCRILNGLGMSLYQGVVQIELWTGKEAPVEAMRRELTDILAEKAWSQNHAESEVFGKQGVGKQK
ncbi:MAG: shikimate dehydrogenase, partial [Oscillospiraceae bacterium]|nr:shikimate dehydrogenase [Oscillospiraceae bacterium]